jgi:hypothetical protein
MDGGGKEIGKSAGLFAPLPFHFFLLFSVSLSISPLIISRTPPSLLPALLHTVDRVVRWKIVIHLLHEPFCVLHSLKAQTHPCTHERKS